MLCVFMPGAIQNVGLLTINKNHFMSGSTAWETAKKVTSQIFLILNIFLDWGLQSAKNASLWWFYICEWIRAITG